MNGPSALTWQLLRLRIFYTCKQKQLDSKTKHTHTRTRDATTLLKHREQTQILTASSVVKKLTEIRDNQGI